MTQAMQMLVAEGLISHDQYNKALSLQAIQGKTLGYYLVLNKSITAPALAKFFATRFPLASQSKNQLQKISKEVLRSIPPKFARSFRILPLAKSKTLLTLGVTDPTSSHTIDEVTHHTGCRITMVIISETTMTWAIDHYYPTNQRSIKNTNDISQPLPLTTPSPSMKTQLQQHDAANSFTMTNNTHSKHSTWEPNKSVRINQTATSDSWNKPETEAAHNSQKASDQSSFSLNNSSDQTKPLKLLYRSNLTDNNLLKKPTKPRHKSEGDIISAIGHAKSRDEIIALSLEHLMRFSKRALFLTVLKTEIRGFSIAGDLTSIDSARAFWVPLSAPSTLSKVARQKQIHLGPPTKSASDAVFAAAFGGRSNRVLIIPIILHDRTIGLLFSDNLKIKLPPWKKLKRLAETVEDAFTRLLSREKTNSNQY